MNHMSYTSVTVLLERTPVRSSSDDYIWVYIPSKDGRKDQVIVIAVHTWLINLNNPDTEHDFEITLAKSYLQNSIVPIFKIVDRIIRMPGKDFDSKYISMRVPKREYEKLKVARDELQKKSDYSWVANLALGAFIGIVAGMAIKKLSESDDEDFA